MNGPAPGDDDIPPTDWAGEAPQEPAGGDQAKAAFMARLAALVARHEPDRQAPEPDLFDPRKER